MYKTTTGNRIDPGGEAGMAHSSYPRANIWGFLAILALSALTVIWLFWHYPLKTSIATVAVLAALGVSARLARPPDTEDRMADLNEGKGEHSN
jgi:hypothetical protein